MRYCTLLLVLFLCFAEIIAKSTTYVIQNGVAKTIDNVHYEDLDEIPETEDDSIRGVQILYNKNGWVQGICEDGRRHPLIYTENFILENDKNSEITGTMQINVGNNSNITCVEVFNRDNSTQPPIFLRGGVFTNKIQVGVVPGYGKGFGFTVKLYGTF